MSKIEIMSVPVARTGMLIRKPVSQVYRALVDPETVTKFWYTASSGPMESGKTVEWEWAMYGLTVSVEVKAVEQDRFVKFDWCSKEGDDPATTVQWKFTSHGDNATYVDIEVSGFEGDGDAILAQVADQAGGFSFVLAAAKALLEHGIQLTITADRHPDGWQN